MFVEDYEDGEPWPEQPEPHIWPAWFKAENLPLVSSSSLRDLTAYVVLPRWQTFLN